MTENQVAVRDLVRQLVTVGVVVWLGWSILSSIGSYVLGVAYTGSLMAPAAALLEGSSELLWMPLVLTLAVLSLLRPRQALLHWSLTAALLLFGLSRVAVILPHSWPTPWVAGLAAGRAVWPVAAGVLLIVSRATSRETAYGKTAGT